MPEHEHPRNAAPHRLIRASAGAGKTYQLATRYLSLLRLGAEPTHILATTFTRKAAGEILGRILNRLAQAVEDDNERSRLDADLRTEPLWRREGSNAALSAAECQRMLGRVIEALHRVNVSTLDSFFHRITRSFALELDVPLEPILLDDRSSQAQQLRLDAIEAMLGEAAGGPDEADELDTFIAMLREVHHDQLKRSVTLSIDGLVADLYEVYRDADALELWSTITAPGLLEDEALRAAIDQLAAMEAGLPRTKQGTPRTRWRDGFAKDLHAARHGQWDAFIRGGIAGKLAAEETHFDRIPVPDDWLAAYQPLVVHARAAQLDALGKQTRSTYELLAKFDRHFTALRRRHGVLLFSDLSHKLARELPAMGPEVMSEVYFRLDGRVNHLLIDEFQDTSFKQWQVLEPMVDEVTAAEAADRSAFIVGDTKQSIYGWRGGCAELFDEVERQLKDRGLTLDALNESFRSSPVVLDAVNRVFGSLSDNAALDADAEATQRWRAQFQAHARAERVGPLAGHVRVMSTPAPDPSAAAHETPDGVDGAEAGGDADDATPSAAAGTHERFVAQRIAELHRRAPHCRIGVLVRRNKTATALLHELRGLDVDASGEGGHPVTDIPAVTAVLAALTLADHPGDEVAAFHVAHSPVGEMLELRDHRDWRNVREVSMRVRRQLLVEGYAEVLSGWVTRLAPACDARGLSRLERLIQLAERYEQEMAQPLRPGRFVDFAAATSVEEPTAAPVRVMTIHASKGLEFDAVVLPELDAPLNDRTQVLVDRETPIGPVRAVYRNPDQHLRSIMPMVEQAYEQHRQRQRFEDLCTLYVAMTRARQALHIYLRPRTATKTGQLGALRKSLASVVREAVRPPDREEDPAGGELLYEAGVADWMSAADEVNANKNENENENEVHKAGEADGTDATAPSVLRLQLARSGDQPRRSWLAISPSSMEAAGRVRGADLLDIGSSAARERGTLMHAWMEMIGFLDQPDAVPDDASLIDAARRRMPEVSRRYAEAELTALHEMLAKPAVREVLESRGADTLWCERPFVLRHEGKLMRGTFDRVAVTHDAEGAPVSATLLDFKTDHVPDAARRSAAVHRYTPQILAYRTALARVLGLDEPRITAQLVFLGTGEVVDVAEAVESV